MSMDEAQLPVLFRPLNLTKVRNGSHIQIIKPRHQKVISLYISGYKKVDIAAMTSFCYDQILNILDSPIVKAYIAAEFQRNTEDLKALMPLAVGAMRDTLMFDKGKTRLSAADMVLKTQGVYKDTSGGRETAEDVIARALDIMKDQSGAIRDLTKARDVAVGPPAAARSHSGVMDDAESPHTDHPTVIDVSHVDVQQPVELAEKEDER